MAVKRNGLGKGLDSLIPDKTSKALKPDNKDSTDTKKTEGKRKVN